MSKARKMKDSDKGFVTDPEELKAEVLRKDTVVVNTPIDVICPSIFPGKRRGQMPLRCERGVGHEGVCQGGNHEWLMTEREVLVTDSIVEQLAHPPDPKGNVWR